MPNVPEMEEPSAGIEAYRRRLNHPDEGVRRAVCMELAGEGWLGCDQLLFDVLADPSPYLREIAAAGLVELATEKTVARLAEMLRLEDPAARNEAMAVLVHLGDRARPSMERLLADGDSDVRIFAANVLGDIRQPAGFEALAAALADANENVRYAAAEALGKIGDPRAVGPLLEAVHTDDWVRFAAIESLGQLADPAAVPHLVPLLSDPWLRLPAIEALGRLGDGPLGWQLLPHVSDENAMVGHATIAALGRLDARHGTQYLARLDAVTVATLVEGALTETDPAVRRSAVIALGWGGPAMLLPRLLERLDDTAGEVQDAARTALVSLGRRELPALLEVFARPEADHRTAMAAALGEICDPAAAEALIAALSDESGPVRAAVAASLGRLGSAGVSPHAEAALLARLCDASADVRRAAAGALGMLRSYKASGPLIGLLGDPVETVRIEAAAAVARIGAPGVAGQLASLLAGASSEAREAAARALGLLAQAGADSAAEAFLIEALNNCDLIVRRLAAAALGRGATPSGGSGQTTTLLTALLDEDWQVRKLAAEALGRLGDSRAAAGLLGALSDHNLWVRYAAVRALGELGDRAAVDALLRTLDGDEDAVKLAAVGALGQLGDPKAIPALEAMSRHPDPDFRCMAAEALGRIWKASRVSVTSEVSGNTAEGALRPLLFDPQPSVRRVAAQMLGAAGGE